MMTAPSAAIELPAAAVAGRARDVSERLLSHDVIVARVLTAYYFLYFLVILPALGYLETPRPLPASISEPVLPEKSAAAVAMGARAPERKG